MSELISVDERLPDDDSLIVGFCFYDGTYNGMLPDAAVFHFLHRQFYIHTDGLEVSYPGGRIQKDMDITHWMPIPKGLDDE